MIENGIPHSLGIITHLRFNLNWQLEVVSVADFLFAVLGNANTDRLKSG